MIHVSTWHTVCDAVFDQHDAEVVCRELDCGAPVQVLGAAAFGKGDSQMWTQEIQCRGNESSISFCSTSSPLNHNCTHENDIGLLCSGRFCETDFFWMFHTVKLNSLYFLQVTLISGW